MAASAKPLRPTTQLIAFTADKVSFYYGELHDDHIFRGSSRGLYASNVKILEMSADWKAYLGDRNVEIEQPSSKWVKVKLETKRMKYMLRHDSGYVMPLLVIKNAAFCKYFPRMADSAPVSMPTQTVRPPGIVAESAAAAHASSTLKVFRRRRDDDADSEAEAVCNGDDDVSADDGKKERDALRAAVESMMSRSRPKSASKVSFK
jgi:hypothetical protein